MLRLAWLAAAMISLTACGGPVPSDMYLTLSVSTSDVAIVTAINGKANDFVSSDSGFMTGSMPLNDFVHEGENEVSFLLTPLDGQSSDPTFEASLQVSLPGDLVDTQEPGDRLIFERALTESEAQALVDGESVTIVETFTVDKAALEEMKAAK